METNSNGGKKKGSCLPKVIVAFVIIGIIGAALPDKKIESLSISIPDQQEEYDINTDIPVTITSDPEDADLNDLEYQTSSSDITFSKSGINTGSDEGTYEIYVESGDITSNTLSINVVDFTARAEAEAEARRLAEEQAQKEAEEQAAREAAEQAEKEAEEKRLAEEKAAQEAAEKAAAPAASANSTMVWIDDTAKRYHKKNGCGMDNAYQVTLEEAIAKGKTPCKNCYK